MSITRIAILEDFSSIIAGRDLAGIFTIGHVYSVTKIMDQIIITDLGKHAKMKHYKGAGFPAIIMDGSYLLTAEEKVVEGGKE